MRLPILKKISIKHLSLYNGQIDRKVLPGINMVVGGNGLGKTTFVNTIIYALVGNINFETLNIKTGKTELVPLVSPDYFVGRIEPRDQELAEVSLSYTVNKYDITVTRLLYRPRITKIRVGGGRRASPKVYNDASENLDDIYRSIAEEVFEVDHLEDFAFVVAHLLLFDEDRRTLAWDSEVQNKMLRLLFLSKEFDKGFSKLSELVTQYDTQGRHKSESRKDIRRAIERWLEDKQKTNLEPISVEAEQKQSLEIQLAKLRTATESLEEEYKFIEERIDAEMQATKSLVLEMNNSELARIAITNQLAELEQKFYSDVYQTIPPQYILLLETLTKEGLCQVCGTSHSQLKKLGKNIKQSGQCIVCRSPVQYPSGEDEVSNRDGFVNKINDLRSRLEQIDAQQREYSTAEASSTKEVRRLQELASEKAREKHRMVTEVNEIQAKLTTQRAKESENPVERDEWLEKQEKIINDLDRQIDHLYKRRSKAREELQELNTELVRLLDKVNEDLTPLFSHFASKFLGTECELVISTKTRASKPIAFMYPKFYGKDREQSNNVSESQRFFLDQAFRMALIDLFVMSTGSPTFYIAETPEGSLDLAYERNVATMYLEFANAGHSVIITSNLNSSRFLQTLYAALGDEHNREDRTLDLLKYGRLSTVQQRERRDFKRAITQLQLPFEWPQ